MYSNMVESILVDIVGKEPLPKVIQIFQPNEYEQILLPDSANCLSVQAFLRMCNLNYEVVQRKNAEEMSPSGRLPFVKSGNFLISELEPLTSFLESKGISLTGGLDNVQKSDMRAYMSLINTVLYNVENYITWVDWDTFNKVTKVRYGSVHPWPLNWIVTREKRQRVFKRLSALGWLNKNIEQVFKELEICCTALAVRLDTNKYFFGDKPTELDAMMFAHIFTILSTPLPSNQFAATIQCYHTVVEHCKRVEQEYFNVNNTSVVFNTNQNI